MHQRDGTALERSPGSYHGKGEEALRDHLLVVLETHYEGQAHAEAFRKSGKTDILINAHGNTLFVGECKWWDGPRAMDAALDQLYGYSTWRDSRLALIFFVDAEDITAIIEKARATMSERPEYLRAEKEGRPGEVRCRISWPGDPDREATLSIQFFHLPGAR